MSFVFFITMTSSVSDDAYCTSLCWASFSLIHGVLLLTQSVVLFGVFDLDLYYDQLGFWCFSPSCINCMFFIAIIVWFWFYLLYWFFPSWFTEFFFSAKCCSVWCSWSMIRNVLTLHPDLPGLLGRRKLDSSVEDIPLCRLGRWHGRWMGSKRT